MAGTCLEAEVTEAETALQLGEHDKARARFHRLLPRLEGTLRVRAEAGLGVLEAREGDLQRGLELLEQAYASAPQYFLSIATAVEELGRTYATRGDYNRALALFTDAMAEANEAGDRPRALKAVVLLANTYIDLGDRGRSVEMLAEALREAAELRDPMLHATVLWSQARLHTIEGRQDLAADFASRALDTLRVNEDDRASGLAHQVLAYIELERDNARHALEHLDTGLPLVERSARRLEVAVYQLERARALIRLGELGEAHALLQQVAPALQQHARIDGGRCLVTLGELYEQIGNPEDALVMYDLATDRLQGPRNPYVVRAYARKGALLESLGRTEDALAALKAALAAQERDTHES